MRKNKRDAAPTKDLTVKALLADVFGLNRTAEQRHVLAKKFLGNGRFGALCFSSA